MLLKSKFASTCATCGKPYKKGDTIEWTRELGASHPECLQESFDFEASSGIADKLDFRTEKELEKGLPKTWRKPNIGE